MNEKKKSKGIQGNEKQGMAWDLRGGRGRRLKKFEKGKKKKNFFFFFSFFFLEKAKEKEEEWSKG
jgi:hypothetical protein